MNQDIYQVEEKPSKLKGIAARAALSAVALGVTGFVAVASLNDVAETSVSPTESVAQVVEATDPSRLETQSKAEPTPAVEVAAVEVTPHTSAASSPESTLTPAVSVGTLVGVENEDDDHGDEHDDHDDDHGDEHDDD
jgi:uncharacterized protein YbjT (DUF2867 family)